MAKTHFDKLSNIEDSIPFVRKKTDAAKSRLLENAVQRVITEQLNNKSNNITKNNIKGKNQSRSTALGEKKNLEYYIDKHKIIAERCHPYKRQGNNMKLVYLKNGFIMINSNNIKVN